MFESQSKNSEGDYNGVYGGMAAEKDFSVIYKSTHIFIAYIGNKKLIFEFRFCNCTLAQKVLIKMPLTYSAEIKCITNKTNEEIAIQRHKFIQHIDNYKIYPLL